MLLALPSCYRLDSPARRVMTAAPLLMQLHDAPHDDPHDAPQQLGPPRDDMQEGQKDRSSRQH